MKIEHIALNVPDPAAIADWYVANLGMRIVRQSGAPTHTTFLADSDGETVLELYHFDGAAVPDYAAQDPMMLHLAFTSRNAVEQARELAAAGAQLHGEPRATGGGDTLIFLRDPWGIALQLVERTEPLLE
ncbi:MAG: VOC family protein [Spirochaetaceae bacterium]|nr:VOC family protein [Spirochaetaceae bacterium]